MKRRRILLTAATLATLVIGSGMAQGPMEDIDAHLHPNLAAAQHMIAQAYSKIATAQQDNKYDMQGHAEKAKTLLAQASQELKQAAMADNGSHRR